MIIHVTAEMLPAMVPLARDFHAASGAPGTLSPAAWLEAWGRLLEAGDGLILAIPDEEGNILGGIGGIAFNDPNDGTMTIQEAFWYVDPDSRGIGLELLDEFIAIARLKGAGRLLLSHTEKLRPRALKRLYERKGFRPVETSYVKEIA